jgi:hypothetical protein
VIQVLPRARPVADRGLRALLKYAGGPGRKLAPRKGATQAGVYPAPRGKGASPDRRPEPPNFFVPVAALKNMSDRDDIIASIRRTLRMAIGELRWAIVPDLDAVKAEVRRWQSTIAINLAMPGLALEFEPHAMSQHIYVTANGALRELLTQIYQEGMAPDLSDFSTLIERDPRVREFFDKILGAHETIAESHIAQVERIFDRPNPSAESSFRSWLSLILDDLTLFDAAAIVKNPTEDGSRLGEVYNLPGEQIRLYRCTDLRTPQPPEVAYDWADQAKVKAYYNNDELVYMMANPQINGYGKSPVAMIVEKMAGSIYANSNMMEDFSNNNLPFFVFDLGPNVSQHDRDAIEEAWNNKVMRGHFRGIFVGMKEGVKGFMPMPTQPDKTDTTLARLQYWANAKCAIYGLSLNDIGFTQDLHRTTAETQAELTQSRGINSFANIVQGYFNGEIIKGRMWVRDDPEDPDSFDGKSVPCFGFNDVKFEFEQSSPTQRLEEASQMTAFVEMGAMSRNELRKELRQPPIPGGDVYVIPGGDWMRVDALDSLPTEVAPPMEEPPPGEELPPGEEGEEQGQGQAALPPGQPQPQTALPPGSQAGPVSKRLEEGIASIERLAKSLGAHTNGKGKV